MATMQLLADLLCDMVTEDSDPIFGVPMGPLYAAMMTYSIDYDTFIDVVNMAVATGRVRRGGDALYPVS